MRYLPVAGNISPAHRFEGSFICEGKIVFVSSPANFWESLLERGAKSFVLYALEVPWLLFAPPAQLL